MSGLRSLRLPRCKNPRTDLFPGSQRRSLRRRRFTGLVVLAAALLLSPACRVAPPARQTSGADPAAPAPERPDTTLAEPKRAPEEPAPPQEVPAPPALGYQEAARQLLALHPEALRPVTAQGRLCLLLHDLDQDGALECLSLAAAVHSQAEVEALSDPQRLFQPDSPPAAFFLLVSANRSGILQKPQAIGLGEHLVFTSLRKLPLVRGHALPVAVTVTFRLRDGEQTELFVFDGGGLPARHQRTLVENISTQTRLQDIDGDGTVDLLLRERAMEEGTGYETFLSWQRWNGRTFAEHKTTNVVRNLNAFLHESRELMLSGTGEDLLSFAVEPAEINRLRRRGLSDAAILVLALGLGGSGLAQLPEVHEVVLPDVLEDPFSADGTCRLTYRLVDAAGVPYIAAARLRMLPNPFGERQFSFIAP